MRLADIQQFWRHKRLVNYLLLPLAALFAVVAYGRRLAYHQRWLRAKKPAIPVVVVGNVVVGGGGKTPAVIALVQALRVRGFSPGVVSRGFGGSYRGVHKVREGDDWRVCGDEALLIYRHTSVPVCLARRRIDAVAKLATLGCDIAISDDGLQHYAMQRDLEICVVNADYGFGNGWFFPAGPLRELPSRVRTCDMTLIIGGQAITGEYSVALEVEKIYPLSAPDDDISIDLLKNKQMTALAGIANPAAFFTMLRTMGMTVEETISLKDHGRLSDAELTAITSDIILMTEKDAVKYPQSSARLYAIALRCRLPDEVISRVVSLMT